MAKQLNVGDKVKIKKSSQYYGSDDSYNPQKVVGTVLSNDGTDDHPIRVQWPVDANVYNISDLKLAKTKAPKEDLLTEVLYTDECDDVLEVDTSMRGQVYIGAGQLDSDGDFDSEKTIELHVEDVKKLRKQLKAWLDKNHPSI